MMSTTSMAAAGLGIVAGVVAAALRRKRRPRPVGSPSQPLTVEGFTESMLLTHDLRQD